MHNSKIYETWPNHFDKMTLTTGHWKKNYIDKISVILSGGNVIPLLELNEYFNICWVLKIIIIIETTGSRRKWKLCSKLLTSTHFKIICSLMIKNKYIYYYLRKGGFLSQVLTLCINHQKLSVISRKSIILRFLNTTTNNQNYAGRLISYSGFFKFRNSPRVNCIPI